MSPRTILALLLLQLIATAGMFGVIWQVQLITYPQFSSIDSVSFPESHRDYCQRITWIVGPLMLLELGSTAFGVLALWKTRWRHWTIAGLLLVLLTWATTAIVQVPQHEQLSFGFDPEVSKALVNGNWLRVIGWTLHLVVISGILYSWCSATSAASDKR